MASSKKKRKIKSGTADIMKSPVPVITEEKPKKNRTLLTIVCIFLSVVFCFGAVLLTVNLVRNARYVASYDGYGMDEGVLSYFASAYKMNYVSNLPPAEAQRADTDADFWNSIPEGGTLTYAEDLKRGFENYVREILVANALYRSGGSDYSEQVERALSYITADAAFGGSTDAFNMAVAEYGFDYEDLTEAAELYYRYLNAPRSIYGEVGEYVPVAGCSEYLKTYSHVKMVFVESSYLSENKNGSEADIAALRSAISAGLVSEEQIDYLMKHNSIKIEGGVDGEYYFGVNADFTVKIGNTHPDIHAVLEKALTMNEGECVEMPYPNGVCFIYRCAPEEGVYAKSDYDLYFEDFYIDAADYLYKKEVKSLLPEVKIKESFSAVDIVSMPKNIFYRVKFD